MSFTKLILPVVFFISVPFLSIDLGFANAGRPMGSAGVSLGKVDFSISCKPAVKSQFNRGVALLHHMMYSQAEKKFKTVAELDPKCAMAHWGVAMTLLHPLWAEPSKEELSGGWAAVERAKGLNPPTVREISYVAAMEAFYKNWKKTKHSVRIGAWEEAQEKIYKANPGDVDAGAFYALAHLATAPKGDKSFTHQKKAGALLEKLHAKSPEHPGLFHYTIHAYDNPILANRAVKVARGYLKLAPDVPHALHMPSHIFVRLGLWQDVIDWNARSAAAAKKHSGSGPISLHYFHAKDYLMYAYLQQTRDREAQKVLSTINGIENSQDSFASAYAIAAAQARYPLERRQWEDVAGLQIRTHSAFPWDKYPQYESITYFARGLGAARAGDAVAAWKAVKTLDGFYERSMKMGQTYWGTLVDAQRQTVAAWITFSEKNKDQALKMMRKAADLEDSVDKHPVTPGAVLPARELLGDMLMLLGKPGEAIQAYEASLEISPNRFNSLYGAGKAAEKAGDVKKAKSYYSQLLQLTKGAESDRPRVQQAKAFLSKH